MQVKHRGYRKTDGGTSWKVMSAAFVMALVLAACDTGPAESLWDPDATGGTAPVISEVDPPDFALAGVDIVTIRGQNFGATPEANIVFFGSKRTPVIQASTTELSVRAPNTPSPAVSIRVSVVGGDAESFSNSYTLGLVPAVEDFGDIISVEEGFSAASDADGNVYVSMFSGGLSAGIDRFTPDGQRSDFTATTFKWDGIDFGPDGFLYGVRNVRAVFRFPPTGGNQETWAVSSNASARFLDIDFDGAGNAWVVGETAGVVRIAPDKTITEFPFDNLGRSVKVVGDQLFVLVSSTASRAVWRFTIDANSDIGAGEVYVDLTASVTQASAIEAATSGELFVGTRAADPVWIVRTDRTAEPLYPGVMSLPVLSFAWSEDPFLVGVQGRRVPSNEPKLIRINTRMEGVR